METRKGDVVIDTTSITVNESEKSPKKEVLFLGFDFSKNLIFHQLLLSFLIICLTIASGVLIETIFVSEESKDALNEYNYVFFLALLRCVVSLVFLSLQYLLDIPRGVRKENTQNKEIQQNKKTNYIKLLMIFFLAFFEYIGVVTDAESIVYLSYPVKVLMKNSKLVPIMLLGYVILKKKYVLLDYISSLFLITGAIFCQAGNISLEIPNSGYGLMMITVSIFCDSFSHNFKELVLKKMNGTIFEVLLKAQIFGLIIMIIICLWVGNIDKCLVYLWENPMLFIKSLGVCLIHFGVVNCIYNCTKNYGTIISDTILCVRKVFSVALSYFLFPKPFSFYYLLAVIFVTVGVALRIYVRRGK